MDKRILMVAYHFPPIQVSSGVHRTAKFVEYLPKHGWYADVLTVNPRAYMRVSPNTPSPQPNTTVTRSFALDCSRHLSIAGRYLSIMALPDKWSTWIISGFISGLRIIRQQKPEFIWSTYPIPSAHVIAWLLHRVTGTPWIADFRDPMTEESHPADKLKRAAYLWIEKKVFRHCQAAVFTTPDTLAMYQQRYSHIDKSKFHLIANGYDETDFVIAEQSLASSDSAANNQNKPISLVHSGLLYEFERNPLPFFRAVSMLKHNSTIDASKLTITLRASGNEAAYQASLKELKIDDIIILADSIPYSQALQEMLNADGLLLFQGESCNHQIPAKAYEYLRAKRPIFALTHEAGNTAALLRASGMKDIVDIQSEHSIAEGLTHFLNALQQGDINIASEDAIRMHSREHRSFELAKLLNNLNDNKH